jgi:hypothetical protein
MSAVVCSRLDTIKFTEFGSHWVHHRMCLEVSHPIIASAEPGEDWSWCYVDEVGFVAG